MRQPGSDLDLGQESLDADNSTELRAEDFERNAPVMACVPGEIDGRHAAAADLTVDRVPANERCVELRDEIHGPRTGAKPKSDNNIGTQGTNG